MCSAVRFGILGPVLALVTVFFGFPPNEALPDTPQPRVTWGPWAKDLEATEEAKRARPQDLSGLDAAGMNLRGSQFVGQSLTHAVFDHTDLYGVRFWDCVLYGASFKNAHLTEAVFEECGETLEGADFTDAVVTGLRTDSVSSLSPQQLQSTRSYKTKDLRGCTITAFDRRSPDSTPHYDFHNADLRDAKLMHGDFRQCDFTDARIDAMEITSCRISFGQVASTENFKRGFLRNMKISVVLDGNPDFSGIDLTGTQLAIGGRSRASFNDAVIRGCTLGGAILSREAFYRTKSYKQGDLSGITFNHVDMSGWDLSRQNLTGCRFWACNFDGAILDDAVITDVEIRDHLGRTKSLTVEQINSTWNYRHGRMEGIRLPDEIAAALAN